MASLNGVQVAAAAYIGGFTGNNIVQAIQLAYAVSKWDSGAASNDHYGLWQVKKSAHPDLFTKYSWSNPADNGRMANVVFQKDAGLLHPEGGWGGWKGAYDVTTYNNAAPGAKRDYAELKKQLGAGKSPENILGASRTDGSKSPEGSIGGKAVAGVSVTGFLSALTNAATWLRVAEVGLGIILLAVGVAKLTNAVPVATKIAKVL